VARTTHNEKGRHRESGLKAELLVDRLLAATGGSRSGAIHTAVRTHEDRNEIAKDPTRTGFRLTDPLLAASRRP
jgi:hypothetical protein